jgi:mRNA-degrading endonuclease RelE of RelBE toxin-antitoxin system
MSDVIIEVHEQFFSCYDELPKPIQKKFQKQLSYLKQDPKHKSLQIHRLQGSEFWEFRVDKGYRCVFKQEGNRYRLYFVGTHQLIDRF